MQKKKNKRSHCNKEQPPLTATGKNPCTAMKTLHSQKIKINKFLKKESIVTGINSSKLST